MSWFSGLISTGVSQYANSGGGSSGGGLWSGLVGSVGDYFSSGSGWSDLLGGVMAGIGGSAQADRQDKMSDKELAAALALQEMRGIQGLRQSAFEAELLDFYKQRDKHDKRTALDTYGQFSVMNRLSPGYKPAPAPAAPVKPSLENYNGS